MAWDLMSFVVSRQLASNEGVDDETATRHGLVGSMLGQGILGPVVARELASRDAAAARAAAPRITPTTPTGSTTVTGLTTSAGSTNPTGSTTTATGSTTPAQASSEAKPLEGAGSEVAAELIRVGEAFRKLVDQDKQEVEGLKKQIDGLEELAAQRVKERTEALEHFCNLVNACSPGRSSVDTRSTPAKRSEKP